ncbi:MAG TPA: hypothetical protein VF636_04500 [Sphingomonas sp.]|jgi:hypothetical protein
MDRPPSVGRFERLWFASIGFWGLGTLLAWERVQNSLLADPRTGAVAGWAQPFWVGLMAAVSLLVWWLAARRASVAGKWLAVGVAALSAMRALLTLVSLVGGGRNLHILSQAAGVIAALLAVLAAAALFRPDASAWFGEFEIDEDQEAQA